MTDDEFPFVNLVERANLISEKSLPEGPCKALAKSDCYNETRFVIIVSRLFFSIF